MANPPPPYDNITGITRAVMKDNAQESIVGYDGNARPGELVVSQNFLNLYVGNNDGNLILLASSTGMPANITVYDEGNVLTNSVSSINFVGSGVWATNTGSNVTVTVAGSSSGYCGSFYDTTIQTNPVANVPNAMTFNTTSISEGVSIVSNSQITIANTGRYNIQFSAQIDKTDSGTDYIDIWLRKNGTDVAWSNTRVEADKNDAKVVAAWNWVEEVNAGDHYQIMWSSADTDLRLFAQTGLNSPVRPSIPSVILTVTQV